MATTDELQTLRTRIETSEEITEEDREGLLTFDDTLALLGTKYSELRHIKLLRQMTIVAEQVGGIVDALEERDEAEEIVRWVNRTYDNEETNRDYRVALKVFGRRVSDENGEDPPDSLEWIPSGFSRNYDPAPQPSEMLDWTDDVLPMIDAAINSRDAAAIALQFDAGLRGWEFKDPAAGLTSSGTTHGTQS